MVWELFGRGLIIGFSIAAPVGPIGLLCIQRTLTHGRLTGLATGLGAASADALYGLIAGLGLSAAATFLTGQRVWLSAGGGLFLCYLGVRTFLAQPTTQAAGARAGGLWPAYGSAVMLTLANPMTILSFVAVFAGLGLAGAGGGALPAAALVGGVFVGSAAWWLLLTAVASRVRDRLSPAGLRWVNRGAGALLLGFGVALLAGLLRAG